MVASSSRMAEGKRLGGMVVCPPICPIWWLLSVEMLGVEGVRQHWGTSLPISWVTLGSQEILVITCDVD